MTVAVFALAIAGILAGAIITTVRAQPRHSCKLCGEPMIRSGWHSSVCRYGAAQ